jgi:hypothetical protein
LAFKVILGQAIDVSLSTTYNFKAGLKGKLSDEILDVKNLGYRARQFYSV